MPVKPLMVVRHLNVHEVERVLLACLYDTDKVPIPEVPFSDEGDPFRSLGSRPVPEGAVLVEGIVHNFGFNPIALKEHKLEISAMVDELHEGFRQGWSFLNLCLNKWDEQWTGEHRVMEMLVCLAIAIGKMRFVAPKEMWHVFPGGMPYIVFEP